MSSSDEINTSSTSSKRQKDLSKRETLLQKLATTISISQSISKLDLSKMSLSAHTSFSSLSSSSPNNKRSNSQQEENTVSLPNLFSAFNYQDELKRIEQFEVHKFNSLQKSIALERLSDFVKLCAQKDRDLNKIDTIHGFTSLYLAVALNKPNIVLFLLGEKNAIKIEKRNGEILDNFYLNKYTPIDVNLGFPVAQRTPLMLAAMLKHIEIAKILLNHNALIDLTDKCGCTPIFYTIIADDNDELFMTFVNANASLDIADGTGQTLLHYAAKFGKTDMVKVLLEKKMIVDKVDALGMTPLMYAIQKNHLKTVSLLLNAGADINYKTPSGLNYFDFTDFENFNEELWVLMMAQRIDVSQLTKEHARLINDLNSRSVLTGMMIPVIKTTTAKPDPNYNITTVNKSSDSNYIDTTNLEAQLKKALSHEEEIARKITAATRKISHAGTVHIQPEVVNIAESLTVEIDTLKITSQQKSAHVIELKTDNRAEKEQVKKLKLLVDLLKKYNPLNLVFSAKKPSNKKEFLGELKMFLEALTTGDMNTSIEEGNSIVVLVNFIRNLVEGQPESVPIFSDPLGINTSPIYLDAVGVKAKILESSPATATTTKLATSKSNHPINVIQRSTTVGANDMSTSTSNVNKLKHAYTVSSKYHVTEPQSPFGVVRMSSRQIIQHNEQLKALSDESKSLKELLMLRDQEISLLKSNIAKVNQIEALQLKDSEIKTLKDMVNALELKLIAVQTAVAASAANLFKN